MQSRTLLYYRATSAASQPQKAFLLPVSVLSVLLAAEAAIQHFWHHPVPDNRLVRLRFPQRVRGEESSQVPHPGSRRRFTPSLKGRGKIPVTLAVKISCRNHQLETRVGGHGANQLVTTAMHTLVCRSFSSLGGQLQALSAPSSFPQPKQNEICISHGQTAEQKVLFFLCSPQSGSCQLQRMSESAARDSRLK